MLPIITGAVFAGYLRSVLLTLNWGALFGHQCYLFLQRQMEAEVCKNAQEGELIASRLLLVRVMFGHVSPADCDSC
ncbi:MAG: hypothetical protein ACLU38_04680 [Dysosmobacter sp.]